ncbi:MAG: 4-hydroxybenzoate 3-monooxygenase [Acidimicrobiales bacterium]
MGSDTTQVAIVGAGPAGLVLAHLLARAGIDSVVLEARDRDYVEARVRAGVLEHGTVRLMDELGVAARLHREGLVHHGIVLQFEGRRHRIDFADLTGRSITVYGQQELVKDLIAARMEAGGRIEFEAPVLTIAGLETDSPVVRYRRRGEERTLACDVVAGCDGSHGVSRASVPGGALRACERDHPYAWLGVLAEVAPSSEELIYAYHRRGFALHSLRSPDVSRLYLQVDPGADVADWPDDRIWEELQVRLGSAGWSLGEGPIVEKGVTPMRSLVTEPMQVGRLFLAGDAAHIVPPTGAKGLNLAVADVKVLGDALTAWYRSGDDGGMRDYSRRCLERVWRAQEFATAMTTLLHLDPGGDAFARGLQRARQHQVRRSRAAAASLAESYVGLPFP